jgi:uncharacterized membrane protein
LTGDVLKKIGRRYLMSGLLVWLPILATVFVIRFALDVMDRTLLLLPPSLRPQALLGVNIPGLGAILAVVLLIVTGMLVGNIVGRSVMQFWEELLNRIPFVRAVYGGVKSFSTTILSNKGSSFKRVLLIQYPSPGLWSVGFQTAEDIEMIDSHLGEPHVCVFIPTTPNPTSGFIVLVPRSKIIELEMSVDSALKMIVTLGVVAPVNTGTYPAMVPPVHSSP